LSPTPRKPRECDLVTTSRLPRDSIGILSEPTAVGMSRQAADVRTTSAQHECRDRRLVICSAFVTVSSPDGKAHFLIGHETRDDCGQASEIRGTLRQELDMVAFGPRDVPWPTRVDLDHRVSAFFG